MISFDGLWKTLRNRGITQCALVKHYHIIPAQITRLKRNESVSAHISEVSGKNCDVLLVRLRSIIEDSSSEQK